ncbi:hypothetical protein ACFLZH_03275 [Patescibacteria group bacterium]
MVETALIKEAKRLPPNVETLLGSDMYKFDSLIFYKGEDDKIICGTFDSNDSNKHCSLPPLTEEEFSLLQKRYSHLKFLPQIEALHQIFRSGKVTQVSYVINKKNEYTKNEKVSFVPTESQQKGLGQYHLDEATFNEFKKIYEGVPYQIKFIKVANYYPNPETEDDPKVDKTVPRSERPTKNLKPPQKLKAKVKPIPPVLTKFDLENLSEKGLPEDVITEIRQCLDRVVFLLNKHEALPDKYTPKDFVKALRSSLRFLIELPNK